MKLKDSISLAWSTISKDKLRTGITVSIIALGITALIGILTATESMNQSLKESFSAMGANGFTIRYKERNMNFGGGGSEVTKTTKSKQKKRKSNQGKKITYQEAVAFKKQYTFPATVSVSARGNFSALAQYYDGTKLYKTNPNVALQGSDENYLELNGYKLGSGRNFTVQDVNSGRSVAIIGYDIVRKCFNENAALAIGKTVLIDNIPYQVIGTLESRGASAFMDLDNIAITTYNTLRRVSTITGSYSIGILVKDYNHLEQAIGQATGLFRGVRKLEVSEESNFSMEKSDAVAEQMIGYLGGITAAAGVIGFITLFGAAIGLMNIMLVAVTERTKEVGLVKAIGGTKVAIRRQFIFESIFISLLGALFGVIFGVLIGNGFGMYLGTGFIMPWGWIVMGFVLCLITGLLSGVYPANKAAKLDPIVALRYE
ncbi:ABC transporter permease [Polluticaenibacter yanchengensis]|uniref:ABC transporter permease n=1 Tax=Polluticaenibacter yanchengensis TaxID=3014562 RepID=A0ABT4UJY6_9BACT|nr:ABC transporter permease [Chitinophagaceae bacterium LY-5]